MRLSATKVWSVWPSPGAGIHTPLCMRVVPGAEMWRALQRTAAAKRRCATVAGMYLCPRHRATMISERRVLEHRAHVALMCRYGTESTACWAIPKPEAAPGAALHQ